MNIVLFRLQTTNEERSGGKIETNSIFLRTNTDFLPQIRGVQEID